MAVKIHASACLMSALLLLTVPLPWLFSAFFAACFHELCHCIAVYALGSQVFALEIRFHGASMEIQPLSADKELICALAGPAGSLLLLLTVHRFPRLALCAAVQGTFNLLPFYPLDGGRALRCVFRLLSEIFLAKRQLSQYNSATNDEEVIL